MNATGCWTTIMMRHELEHAIRAACDVADETELYIFGSQAILGTHPDPPEELRQSIEVDVAVVKVPEKADLIDGALGEWSPFHQEFEFYVHGLLIEAATLPEGWKNRVVKVQNQNTRDCIGWCLELHDLAASKLAAFRIKDREFVRILLVEGMIKEPTLVTRLESLDLPDSERQRRITWVDHTCRDLD